MATSSKKNHYTIAKILHWSVGFIIAWNLLSGWRIKDFEPEIQHVLIMIHSGIGTAIFLLMLFRWWWRRSHKLYAPPRWWKRPSMLLQWSFYPLIVIQPVIGVLLAAFIDYEVFAFGFINYSALAADSESLHSMFLQWHGTLALLLIFLVLIHGLERSKKLFVD
jgi:cytochrome b561|tara:strand:- start:874 stop:1365 length:492 start_codon:yes stop_codon:yes gene_type:complete